MKNELSEEPVLKISFTGHRPKSLPWGYDETKESYFKFRKVMQKAIKQAIKNGYFYFITGMLLVLI